MFVRFVGLGLVVLLLAGCSAGGAGVVGGVSVGDGDGVGRTVVRVVTGGDDGVCEARGQLTELFRDNFVAHHVDLTPGEFKVWAARNNAVGMLDDVMLARDCDWWVLFDRGFVGRVDGVERLLPVLRVNVRSRAEFSRVVGLVSSFVGGNGVNSSLLLLDEG